MHALRVSLASFFFLISFLLQAADVESFVDQAETEGAPILYTITVSYEASDEIMEPQVFSDDNWDLRGPSVRQSFSSTYRNGSLKTTRKKQYAYSLIPKKEGKHFTPEATITINGEDFDIPAKSIQVHALNGHGGGAGSYAQQVPHGFGAPSQRPQNSYSRQQVVLSAEPSKTEVYVGELIELPFYVYYQGSSLSNVEFGKFPEFKGFLKEELVVPKRWKSERSELNGQSMMRSQIIRYALFPLRAGELMIDPLKLRIDAMLSPDELFEDFFNGALGSLSNFALRKQRLEKNSGIIPVKVKELPPVPEQMSFGGGVGDFSIEWSGPREFLQQDQPFIVKLSVRGKGNIKSIEEPKLLLPEGIEHFKTSNEYFFGKDARGHKSFEYLLKADKAGVLRIPGIEWAYFDPEAERYIELKTKELVLNVEGGGGGIESSEGEVLLGEEKFELKPVLNTAVALKKKKAHAETWLKPVYWSLPLGLYAAFAFLFVRRKREDQLSAQYARYPWMKTEKELLALSERSVFDYCVLVDLWMRQKLLAELSSDQYDMHSSFDDLVAAFESKESSLASSVKASLLQELRALGSELNHKRFTGKRNEKLKGHALFKKAQSILEKLTAS